MTTTGTTNEYLERLDADRRMFAEEWRSRSVSLGFSQQSPVLDPVTGMAPDFAEIADPDEVREVSARCEEQYLKLLMANRDEFLERWPEHSRERAHYRKMWYRDVCKTDAYFLGKYILGFKDFTFHYHQPMCAQTAEITKKSSWLFEHMRGAFKTTIYGILFCIQEILKDPNVTILYLSQTLPNASNKLEEIKNKFYYDEALDNKLLDLFPEYAVRTSAEKGSGIRWNTPARTNKEGEATITAAGITKTKEGMHVEIIVCDDIWGENSVSDQEQMSKIRARFSNVRFLFKATGQKKLVVIGTRFSMDDLTEDIRKKPEFRCTIVSGLTAAGRSIFPEAYDLADFMRMVDGGDEDGGDDDIAGRWSFSCQIILNPTSTDAGFKREWFRYEPWADAKAQANKGQLSYRLIMLLDAAVDDKKGSDDVAIGIVAMRSDHKAHLIECLAEKIGPAAFVKTVEGLWDKWRPEFIVRQKTSLETTLISFFKDLNKTRVEKGKSPLRFHNYSLRKREKKSRITASLQPRLSRGQLIFDPGLKVLPKIEQSFLDHPNTSKDDIPDMLSALDDKRVWRWPDLVLKPAPVEEPKPPTEKDVYRADMEQKRQQAARAFRMARLGRPRPQEHEAGMVA